MIWLLQVNIGLASTGALIAQSQGLSGYNVPVALIDCGVTQPVGRPVVPGRGFNLFNPADSLDYGDRCQGHGTHKVNILYDMAPGLKPFAYRVDDGAGQGKLSDVAIMLALQDAERRGIWIASISIGNNGANQGLIQTVQHYLDAGGVIVAGVGNGGCDSVQYVARLPGVIGVGSVSHDGQRSSFSNCGSQVMFVVEGENITSWCPEGPCTRSGTSTATPFVAALYALFKSILPQWSNNALTGLLVASSRDLGAPGRDVETGVGWPNAGRALDTLYAHGQPHVRLGEQVQRIGEERCYPVLGSEPFDAVGEGFTVRLDQANRLVCVTPTGVGTLQVLLRSTAVH